MISGHERPEQVQLLGHTRYMGTITTCGGSIMVTRTSTKATFRPFHRIFARA